MAKVTGPLFSLSAKGSIAKTLTYKTVGGQAVVGAKIPRAVPHGEILHPFQYWQTYTRNVAYMVTECNWIAQGKTQTWRDHMKDIRLTPEEARREIYAFDAAGNTYADRARNIHTFRMIDLGAYYKRDVQSWHNANQQWQLNAEPWYWNYVFPAGDDVVPRFCLIHYAAGYMEGRGYVFNFSPNGDIPLAQRRNLDGSIFTGARPVV